MWRKRKKKTKQKRKLHNLWNKNCSHQMAAVFYCHAPWIKQADIYLVICSCICWETAEEYPEPDIFFSDFRDCESHGNRQDKRNILLWKKVENRMLYVGIQESVLLYVWLLFSFKADHKAARMVMPFSAQDGAILADYRNEAECSLLAKGKHAKAD